MKAYRRCPRSTGCPTDRPTHPHPKENEVLYGLLIVESAGPIFRLANHKGYESVLPEVTFGHEFSATVVETGSSVTNWKKEDHAVMIALQTHHQDDDPYCAMGLPQLSSRRRVQGLHLDGGMAEYVCVEEEFLLPIPSGLDLKLAALTEPLSVAEHCIGNRTSIGPGDKVIVSGPGIIGLLCAISARSRGAEVIISGTEQDESTRLSAARTIGFETLVVGSGQPPLHEQIVSYFTNGADVLVKPRFRPCPTDSGNPSMPMARLPQLPCTPLPLISILLSSFANR